MDFKKLIEDLSGENLTYRELHLKRLELIDYRANLPEVEVGTPGRAEYNTKLENIAYYLMYIKSAIKYSKRLKYDESEEKLKSKLIELTLKLANSYGKSDCNAAKLEHTIEVVKKSLLALKGERQLYEPN